MVPRLCNVEALATSRAGGLEEADLGDALGQPPSVNDGHDHGRPGWPARDLVRENREVLLEQLHGVAVLTPVPFHLAQDEPSVRRHQGVADARGNANRALTELECAR